MEQNPFAPPSASADRPQGGLVFSPEGVSIVASLATWMRGLSILYFLFIGLLALGSCATCAGGGSLRGAGGAGGAIAFVFIVVMVVIGAAASWLRSAAQDFERGVLSDDEMPIGQGFGHLRSFLILFGILGLLSLAFQIYQAVQVL
ncbi:MAG: hypothetical protein K0V04_16300 [Deltaproteobacteria bacterium]|nr:hypothetical protein [Deltaproteobacteria bacterium]